MERRQRFVSLCRRKWACVCVQDCASMAVYQSCQIFLGATYQNGEKCTQRPQNIPNGHKIGIPVGRNMDQTVIKYTNIFRCSTLQNLPKLVFLV
jgi:hypothetical protein